MVEIKVNFIAGLTLSNARYIKKKTFIAAFNK